MSLLERIEHVLRTSGVSQRELARRAKLKDERHLGVILSRLRKNPDADIERETLAALAEGAGVSLVWLATGNGSSSSEGDDSQRAPTTVPDAAPPVAASIPDWDAAEQIARQLEPDLPDVAFERARKSAALITTAHASPELVLQLARIAVRFAGPDLFEQIRAKDAEKVARHREAHRAWHEEGKPLPRDVERDELTPEGERLVAEGKLEPPPPYEGEPPRGAEGAREARTQGTQGVDRDAQRQRVFCPLDT